MKLRMIARVPTANLLVTMVLTGCGSGTTRDANTAREIVSGAVMLNGQPLTTGSLLLEKTDRSVATMFPINSDGSFTAKTLEGLGLPLGEYRVAVSPIKIGETNEFRLSVNVDEEKPTSEAAAIPPRYQKLGTSPLTFTVTTGKNPPLRLELVP